MVEHHTRRKKMPNIYTFEISEFTSKLSEFTEETLQKYLLGFKDIDRDNWLDVDNYSINIYEFGWRDDSAFAVEVYQRIDGEIEDHDFAFANLKIRKNGVVINNFIKS